jgi:hypothetical protein
MLSAEPAPVAVVCWLSDVYHRSCADPGTTRRVFALWQLAQQQPKATRRLPDRLQLLEDFAAAEFGPDAAAHVVDGWISLHEAFEAQLHNPYPRPRMRFLSTYGPIAHRWLTRPLVAFPGELTGPEERHFLPHVFAVGDEARRGNLLDQNGYPAADPSEDYRLRSSFFAGLTERLTAAAAHFGRVAARAEGQARLARKREVMLAHWQDVARLVPVGRG